MTGKWSKNQVMTLIGLVVAIIAVILSGFNLYYYVKLEGEQIIIKEYVDEVNSKTGKFEKLITSSLWINNSKEPYLYFNGSHVIISGLEVAGNVSISDTNITIGDMTIRKFNSTCVGFRFGKTGGVVGSCN